MPAQNRLRLDKQSDQGRTVYPLAQRRNDRPIRHCQLRPLELPAHDPKLVPQQKQLRSGVVDSQSYVKKIQEQPEQ